MGASNKKTVIGYEYYAHLHMGVGLAADEIYRIDIGEKNAWTGSIKQNGSIFIDQYSLFGGKKGEGGVVGTVEVMFGGENQPQNGILAQFLGGFIPAFRGTVTMLFSGMLCSMNWYPKTWDIYYRRIKSGWNNNSPWYPEKIEISLANGQIKAMNPAHILYESYTSTIWGAGVPAVRMDEAAYKKAADTLYAEGFGLCFEWNDSSNLKDLREMVTSHIGALLDTDPRTGKNTIRLIRDDYNVDELPVFDEDNGLLEFQFEASNNTEVPSQVIVKYNDAITFEDRPAYANNPAISQIQRSKSVETVEYTALPTGELATRVAYRDLKAKTSGIKRCTLKLDRRGYDIVKGQPFRIKTKYRLNNVDIIVRADRIQESFLTDGAIKINAVQDVFSLPKLSLNPTPSIPEPVIQKPIPVTNSLLLEATYRDLAMIMDTPNLQLLEDTSTYFYGLAQSPGNVINYDLMTRVKGASKFNEPNDVGTWCQTAVISSDIGLTDTVIHIEDNLFLSSIEEGSAALINGEIVRIDKVDVANLQITVGRGCVDTVPAQHKAGATVWFFDGNEATDGIEYDLNTTIEAKFLSNTFADRLALDKAATQSITLQGRQARPYPPANLKINGIAYPTELSSGSIVVSWSHRNRLIQADKLIDTTMENIIMEDNVGYNLKVYVNGALSVNKTELTDNNYTITETDLGASFNRDLSLMQFENNLTDESGLIWQQNGTPLYVDGIIQDYALSLNSTVTPNYLYLPANNDFNFGKSDFTIECWVRLASNPTTYGVIFGGADTSFNSISSFLMYKNGSASPYNHRNKFVFGVYSDTINSTTEPVAGEWYHLAISRQGNTIRMFVNGKKEAESNFTANVNFSVNGSFIGYASYNGDNGLFKGDLDQFRVTKGCLYTEGFTPSTEPYLFNSGSFVESKININLSSSRGSLASWQAHDYTFTLKP